ncbi:MAG: 3-methyl-2-oxobutanoate hydroxymethyltransferase [Bacillota bacterium]|nr:3-methyl-2-oxobutanoate hydroxymethyltransferase [Bacillota bacterium]
MSEKFTIADFKKARSEGRKITMLTAYDYPTAKILDEAGVDSILVGDSLGMVVLGYEDTVKVTMEDMIHHIKAVCRAAKHSYVVGDMPFLSYHIGKYESVRNAGRLMSEGGCSAVKMEGGKSIVEDVKAIISAGIPVMGHLGYTPQSINLFGGHKAQGKSIEKAQEIINDALELQEAGVFAIVLECIPYKLAALITEKLDIPTISIGAGPHCTGQVLVTPDITGMFRGIERKHSKKYADVGGMIEYSAKEYIREVNEGIFPAEKNSFIIDEEIIEQLKKTN